MDQNVNPAHIEKDYEPVAPRLIDNKQTIVLNWEQEVRQRSSNSKDYLILSRYVSKFIDQLANTLSKGGPVPYIDLDDKVKLEIENKDESVHYRLEQIIFEHHVLLNSLLNYIGFKTQIAKKDREIIVESIFTSIQNAVSSFSGLIEKPNKDSNPRIMTEAELSLELLVQETKDYAIFTLDRNGIIKTWNEGCTRIKQYTSDETIGNHYEMLYPPEGRRRDEPMGHLRSALIEGRFRGEGVRMKKDGSLFFADVTITPLYLDGNHIGFGKVVQDLSERNRLIQERDISRAESENLRIEQTLRERFVAALSHDLRTPLTAAKMSAKLLERHNSVDYKRKLTSRIVDNLDRIDKMIRDLLDASRIKAGEPMSIDIQKCDMTEIVVNVCDDLATIYGDRFVINRKEPLVGYWCPDCLKRILDNLLSNGVKYGEISSPVTVDMKAIDNRVLLTVHNFGDPISSEDQLVLFDPYRRAKSAQIGDKKGWGLGLTLVRGLTEAHGGVVKLESYPIEGTRFTIDLPIDSRSLSSRELNN